MSCIKSVGEAFKGWLRMAGQGRSDSNGRGAGFDRVAETRADVFCKILRCLSWQRASSIDVDLLGGSPMNAGVEVRLVRTVWPDELFDEILCWGWAEDVDCFACIGLVSKLSACLR